MERRRKRGPVGPPRRDQGSPRRRPELDFDDLVYGMHSVSEALAAGERLHSIHVSASRTKDAALRALLVRAKDGDVPVRFEQRAFFDRVPFKTHQGIVAIAPPFSYASLHDLVHGRREGPRTFVILDHLTDPHNVGAIIRTAEAAGADGVILPARRSAGVNATVRKAAAGAAEHLPIARVANIADAIRVLKKAGVWVVGADASPEATDLLAADLNRDLALVVGAEGGGLSALVKRECDYLVRIPMRGRVASLNASVATAILIYEALRQRECSLRP